MTKSEIHSTVLDIQNQRDTLHTWQQTVSPHKQLVKKNCICTLSLLITLNDISLSILYTLLLVTEYQTYHSDFYNNQPIPR